MNVEQAASLKMDAADSDVTLRGVKKLLPLALRGCTGEIDLLETLGSLTSSSTQGSRIDIEIPEPCEVRASGAGATLGNNIRCSGCDLKLPSHPKLGNPKQYIRRTRRAILELTLDEDSRVGIRGR